MNRIVIVNKEDGLLSTQLKGSSWSKLCGTEAVPMRRKNYEVYREM